MREPIPHLRQWQQLALSKSLTKYSSGHSHFMCVAAPGAGKTLFSAVLAKSLLKASQIDFVLCFAPSVSVANGIKDTFISTLNDPFDGRMGSKGKVVTYQGLQHQYSELAHLIKNYRVLVVSDEIHHCAYGDDTVTNHWGQVIDSLISVGTPLTLTLSGTPWRSNSTKIALQNYLGEPEELKTDYVYGLSEAVADKVCLRPNLILLDNHSIEITENSVTSRFQSISQAIDAKKLIYRDLLLQDDPLNQLIKHAQNQLSITRVISSAAAGLVVASSVDQAKRIANILIEKHKQKVVIVSYDQINAQEKIRDFQNSDNDWIVSIGMVSEGTDIPRLQVCAYLSNVRTELYFRQVLGRILRVNLNADEPCYLIAFAEPHLIEFSERISEDLPGDSMQIKVIEPLQVDFDSESDASIESQDVPSSDSMVISSNVDSLVDPIDLNWNGVHEKVQAMLCRDSYRALILSL